MCLPITNRTRFGIMCPRLITRKISLGRVSLARSFSISKRPLSEQKHPKLIFHCAEANNSPLLFRVSKGEVSPVSSKTLFERASGQLIGMFFSQFAIQNNMRMHFKWTRRRREHPEVHTFHFLKSFFFYVCLLKILKYFGDFGGHEE